MRVRVVVFDDEPMIRRVFSVVPHGCGYDVEVFHDASPTAPE